MTQENQELLLKDLCGRTQHGVKCQVYDFSIPYTLSGIIPSRPYQELYFEELDYKECNGFVDIKHCKPYLFPLSSMTEEQRDEFDRLYTYDALIVEPQWELIDFCDKHHLDYRGLIPMGLAEDATNLNIY